MLRKPARMLVQKDKVRQNLNTSCANSSNSECYIVMCAEPQESAKDTTQQGKELIRRQDQR